MPSIERLSIILPMYQIILGMTVLFTVGAVAALVYAIWAGLLNRSDDITVRMLDFEDRPLANPHPQD